MATVNMKKYLKKYMSKESRESKKKTAKKKSQQETSIGTKLIDDDIDLKMIKGGFQEIVDLEIGEDAPQIANIVDERPLIVRAEEQFSSDKWKAVGADGDLLRSIKKEPQSPPSRSRSPIKVRTRRDSDSDQSPPRNNEHDIDSDQSPPRNVQARNNETRNFEANYDSDQSPPRPANSRNIDANDDSDQSPPRHVRLVAREKKSELKPTMQKVPNQSGRHDSDSDQSPVRPGNSGTKDSSPPRIKRHYDSDSSLQSDRHKNQRIKVENQPKINLEGKKSGLQSAKDMRKEIKIRQRMEQDLYDKMDPLLLGKGAAPIVRDKSGKKVDLAEKARLEKERKEREAERAAKYAKWGKGLKQQQLDREKMETDLHEMSKPLARYKDDADLDEYLKKQEREGDPMLLFKKKPANEDERPKFKGPTAPNRFNILPGFRWDGVDRSNGFELQRFSRLANRKVVSEDTYKWSIEDM